MQHYGETGCKPVGCLYYRVGYPVVWLLYEHGDVGCRAICTFFHRFYLTLVTFSCSYLAWEAVVLLRPAREIDISQTVQFITKRDHDEYRITTSDMYSMRVCSTLSFSPLSLSHEHL